MTNRRIVAGWGGLSSALAILLAVPAAQAADPLRVATFNASLNRLTFGQLELDLSTPNNLQARTVAEIIQRVNPDVLLINEFDFRLGSTAPADFVKNYLNIGQNVSGAGAASPVNYPHMFYQPSNTGIPSGFDLDNSGSVGGGNDALGFGAFPGQFGMLLLSKFDIREDQARTFQNFLWKDMPGAVLPPGFYSDEELAILPLSSKSHWDVPIEVNGEIVHILASHPTPPVFDGLEDRNGRRNHDEIRLFADYISGNGDYICDDAGVCGGLAPGERFVLLGDQNADPNDGDSFNDAIEQLLGKPQVNLGCTPSSPGGPQQSALQGGANASHTSNPAFDTADFADNAPGNLRADYVLPSKAGLTPVGCGVFWPANTDPLFPLVGTFDPNLPGGFPSSDHRLVFVDVQLVPEPGAAAMMLVGLLGMAALRRR
jgi:3-phytase